MPEVRIVKPFRVSSSEPMRMPGDTVEVDEAMLAKLIRLGIVEDPETPAEGDDEDSLPAPVSEEPEAEPASEPEAPSVESASGSYSPPPEKTAPVAEFKEYARRNEIQLTGLTKRNEIIGYIYKVAAGQ